MISCPLCSGQTLTLIHHEKRREFHQCQRCELVHVPKEFHLSREEEKNIYDLHQNVPTDRGYREFLSRLANPLGEKLAAGLQGLDFGCGPGPTLSLMLEEMGHHMKVYDPFYFPQYPYRSESYDFITLTEVAEHLGSPLLVFTELAALLKPGGLLAVMTRFLPELSKFSQWGYKSDPTHIIFFSEASFNWLAQKLGLQLEIVREDVVFLWRP